jgi:hypothetical protein
MNYLSLKTKKYSPKNMNMKIKCKNLRRVFPKVEAIFMKKLRKDKNKKSQ